jgi:hypothetical protein
MRKIAILCLMLSAAPIPVPTLSAALPLSAQEAKAAAPEVHYYHLEFVVKELGEDGKVVNTRTYRSDISTAPGTPPSSVRTGTRIPIHVSSKGGDDQLQYIDIGVNIDCIRAHETPEGLAMEITAEISSMATPGAAAPTTPIIRQNKWMSSTVLPAGKPTIVFSSDNLENKGRMQVEVTATPIR